MAETQTYANHARIVPLFHYFVLPMFLINLIWAIVEAVRFPATGTIITALTALALILLALLARNFALTVQNRVIRLEMRLRLREQLPPDLQPAIAGLTLDQLVALRFASDGELVDLVRATVRDRLVTRKAIKQMVKDWQGDHLRV
ncbi:MAG TPA: DUF6526 family protein [Vicinamibacterales bacterium]|jgi:hypothetical protein